MKFEERSKNASMPETRGAGQLSELETRLLDGFQRDFPLTPSPFAVIARRLGTTESEVLRLLRQQQSKGAVSRVGPVFRPHAIGTSTLAAMAVPPKRLADVADTVSGYQEVNHNYEREHRYNLWFVLTATGNKHLERVLGSIEQRTSLPVLTLPMQADYHIDLGFKMQTGDGAQRLASRGEPRPHAIGYAPLPTVPLNTRNKNLLDERDWALVAAIQWGLPLVSRPFAAVGRRAGLSEGDVLYKVKLWLRARIIKRMGVIVRHRHLGYGANAMVVWDVLDDRVDTLGRRLAEADFVSLCYRRSRHLPDWPYNLYCMIHGRDRNSVTELIRMLSQTSGADHLPREILFSRQCFKQRGAVYRPVSVERPEAA